ncbi:PilZ domain-containing protein [Methylobacterium sp. J-068]|uniref:PilZ domain-containing protein n=1 Tax=Methylobacterium sp. J-068 TaxID=2836649 RepID=UPI001FBAA9F0|nr:PilZ domain-containing protein [Methylobacterium sp. J-068]MCJ2036509.1 hypothetical protein [Methylobacterium sp. J-068]
MTFAGAETFVVKIHARTPSIASIAKDLVALARQQFVPDTPSRVHRRIVPLRTQVAVHLPCGRTIPGKLLNVSASGAALYVGEPIELGTQFRIGETWASVVRQFESGVGAAFLEPLDPQSVSEHIQL